MLFMRALLLLLTVLVPFESFSTHDERIKIDSHSHKIEYFSQDDRDYFIDYVAKLDDKEWHTTKSALSFGLIPRHYWLRITVDLPHAHHKQWFLESANPLIDALEVYIESDNDFIEYQAGDTLNADVRPTPTRVFLYPLPQNRPALTIYLKYTSSAASAMHLSLVTVEESLANAATDGYSFGILTSLMLVMILASLASYLVCKRPALLYVCCYALSWLLLTTILEGYASLVVWPNTPWLQNLLSPTLIILCLWLITLLISDVLNFQERLTRIQYKALLLLSRAQIIGCVILLVLPIFISALTAITLLISTLGYLVFLVAVQIKSKHSVSTLSLLTVVTFVLAISSKLLFLSGSIQDAGLPQLFRVFLGLNMTLIAVTLIKQSLDSLHSKQQSLQEQLIEMTESATREQSNLEQQQQEQQTLEALVDERTFELNVTLRELQETNRRLEEQATNDALTGAKNRKFFDQRVVAEYRLSRRQKTPLSLLMLDIDLFKNVNDNYGHLMGDKVLIAFAQKIMTILRRPNDYVCRYGGEEFAVLLSNTDHKGALKVAELIRSKIESHTVVCDGVEINVTVSVGVSTMIIDDDTAPSELFVEADKALYEAKEHGRNQVCSATGAQD